jgi:hypothetical protein
MEKHNTMTEDEKRGLRV